MIHFFSLPQLLPFPFNFFRIVLYACNHTYLPLPVQFIENNSSGTRCIPPPAASEKGEGFWGHPRPRQEDCVPLHPLLNGYWGRFLGAPQTPAGGLRPPAPPAQ